MTSPDISADAFNEAVIEYNQRLYRDAPAVIRALLERVETYRRGEQELLAYVDASTHWQTRALRAEDRIAALEAENAQLKHDIAVANGVALSAKPGIDNAVDAFCKAADERDKLRADLARLRAERDIVWERTRFHSCCQWPTLSEIAARVEQNRKEQE